MKTRKSSKDVDLVSAVKKTDLCDLNVRVNVWGLSSGHKVRIVLSRCHKKSRRGKVLVYADRNPANALKLLAKLFDAASKKTGEFD